jgi:hypothetical protein
MFVSGFAQFFHCFRHFGPNSAPFLVAHGRQPSRLGAGAVEKRSFVVKEQIFIKPLRCGECGGNAHLIRRSPDPDRRDGTEIRIFECHECGHQTLRIVKA